MSRVSGVDWFNLGNDVRIAVSGADFDSIACRVFYVRNSHTNKHGVIDHRGYYLAVTPIRDVNGRCRTCYGGNFSVLPIANRRSAKTDADAIRIANDMLSDAVADVVAGSGAIYDMTGLRLREEE